MKNSVAQTAFDNNAADVLALAEMISNHVEAQTTDAALGGVDWGDVGSMAHLREQLAEILVGTRLGPNGSEEKALEAVNADAAKVRTAQGHGWAPPIEKKG
jgi:hypothetical protein